MQEKNDKYYEMTGIVHKILPVKTFPSGFYKRELVLTNDLGEDTKYPKYVPFTFKKAAADRLEGIREGQRVKVVFALEGREYDGRFWPDVTGLKATVLGDTAKAPEPAVPDAGILGADAADPDLPF